MCGRCEAMKEAFFPVWETTGHFGTAYLAATEAARTYDRDEEVGSKAPVDQVRMEARRQAAEEIGLLGFEVAVSNYADKFSAPLDQEHKALLALTQTFIEAAKETLDGHNGDKVKTILEIGNRLVSMSMTTGTPVYLLILAVVMTELAGCAEACELLMSRENIPGIAL